jgi:hypothetical protein
MKVPRAVDTRIVTLSCPRSRPQDSFNYQQDSGKKILNENRFHEIRHLPNAASHITYPTRVKHGLWTCI